MSDIKWNVLYSGSFTPETFCTDDGYEDDALKEALQRAAGRKVIRVWRHTTEKERNHAAEWGDELSEVVVAYDRSPVCYVAAWEITREYGGPEEGGWWYNESHLIDTIEVPVELEPLDDMEHDLIEQAIATMEERHSDVPWGKISSMAGGAELNVNVWEHRPPPRLPERRPYYC